MSSAGDVCIVRRMPRMQVYLPDELYAELKERGLPASELLQAAVRAEIERQKLIEAADQYLQELIDEVGEPSAEDLAWAEDFVTDLKRNLTEPGANPNPNSKPSAKADTASAAKARIKPKAKSAGARPARQRRRAG